MNRGVEPAPAAVLVVNVYRPGCANQSLDQAIWLATLPTGVSWWHPALAIHGHLRSAAITGGPLAHICRPRILASVALAHTVVAGYGMKEWHGDHPV
jgi:hypothetical protein